VRCASGGGGGGGRCPLVCTSCELPLDGSIALAGRQAGRHGQAVESGRQADRWFGPAGIVPEPCVPWPARSRLCKNMSLSKAMFDNFSHSGPTAQRLPVARGLHRPAVPVLAGRERTRRRVQHVQVLQCAIQMITFTFTHGAGSLHPSLTCCGEGRRGRAIALKGG
jgi:hypothetical protein